MFIEWGFLLGEIWVLLVLAALLGVLVGWIIWGGGKTKANMDAEEVQRLRLALEKERARARASVSAPSSDVLPVSGGGYVRPAKALKSAAASPQPSPLPASDVKETAPQPAPPAEPAVAPRPSPDPAVRAEPKPPAAAGQKPATLAEPQDGLPDDLTKIKGIGKKLEKLCNELGFFHYEQIAEWTDAEVAWVDNNLADFKGRVSRDNWVQQAKDLAGEIPPAFVRRSPER